MQTVLAGAAAMLPIAIAYAPSAVQPLAWTVAGASLAQLLFVWGEATLAHPTEHARLAAHEMIHGRYRGWFWAGIVLVLVGLAAPWLGAIVAPFVLLGVLCHEHAYVQSGQAVPLA